MFETGFIIFLGLVLLLIKLPRRLALRMLHHDLILDCAVTLIVLFIHFGTFSGVMAATVAGLMTSLFTTAVKRAFGSMKGDKYTPGCFNLHI
jgi:NhaP-type Na+/H+ or K+/H+ antiporter